MSFTIENMGKNDLRFALDLAAAEGWNPGVDDRDAFWSADPRGYFVGRLDGRPVGCISGVAYGGTFGFLGLYIVLPEFRGKGYGVKLWDHAMRYLKGRNIGLDGVVAQQHNYKKSGFGLAYRNVRFEGEGEACVIPSGDCELVDLVRVPFTQVEAYDRRCFPERRTQFLSNWVRLPHASGYGVFDNGILVGWGVIRKCQSGHKIGPLFADDERCAETLFQALAATVPGEKIYLDVPEPHEAAMALAERHSMSVVFETARMYTGPEPEIRLDNVFGVTTFELG